MISQNGTDLHCMCVCVKQDNTMRASRDTLAAEGMLWRRRRHEYAQVNPTMAPEKYMIKYFQ